jgi:hypothetical protein
LGSPEASIALTEPVLAGRPLSRPVVSDAWACVCAAVLALSCILPLPAADGRVAHLPDVCMFHALTGLPCPGCGLTRSFVCLAHGRLFDSLRYHPLGPALFAFISATIIYACAERLFPGLRLAPSDRFRRIAPFIAIAVFLAAWAARLAGYDPIPGG